MLAELMPIISAAGLMAAGALLGLALPKLKGFVMNTETKLDDKVWNKLVNEFTAAGVITPDQLAALKNQPAAE